MMVGIVRMDGLSRYPLVYINKTPERIKVEISRVQQIIYSGSSIDINHGRIR